MVKNVAWTTMDVLLKQNKKTDEGLLKQKCFNVDFPS